MVVRLPRMRGTGSDILAYCIFTRHDFQKREKRERRPEFFLFFFYVFVYSG